MIRRADLRRDATRRPTPAAVRIVLREVRVKPELTHNTPSWASFEFEPVADSRGKTFHFSVEPADEAAEETAEDFRRL